MNRISWRGVFITSRCHVGECIDFVAVAWQIVIEVADCRALRWFSSNERPLFMLELSASPLFSPNSNILGQPAPQILCYPIRIPLE